MSKQVEQDAQNPPPTVLCKTCAEKIDRLQDMVVRNVGILRNAFEGTHGCENCRRNEKDRVENILHQQKDRVENLLHQLKERDVRIEVMQQEATERHREICGIKAANKLLVGQLERSNQGVLEKPAPACHTGVVGGGLMEDLRRQDFAENDAVEKVWSQKRESEENDDRREERLRAKREPLKSELETDGVSMCDEVPDHFVKNIIVTVSENSKKGTLHQTQQLKGVSKKVEKIGQIYQDAARSSGASVNAAASSYANPADQGDVVRERMEKDFRSSRGDQTLEDLRLLSNLHRNERQVKTPSGEVNVPSGGTKAPAGKSPFENKQSGSILKSREEVENQGRKVLKQRPPRASEVYRDGWDFSTLVPTYTQEEGILELYEPTHDKKIHPIIRWMWVNPMATYGMFAEEQLEVERSNDVTIVRTTDHVSLWDMIVIDPEQLTNSRERNLELVWHGMLPLIRRKNFTWEEVGERVEIDGFDGNQPNQRAERTSWMVIPPLPGTEEDQIIRPYLAMLNMKLRRMFDFQPHGEPHEFLWWRYTKHEADKNNPEFSDEHFEVKFNGRYSDSILGNQAKNAGKLDRVRGTAENDLNNREWSSLFDELHVLVEMMHGAEETWGDNFKGNVMELFTGASYIVHKGKHDNVDALATHANRIGAYESCLRVPSAMLEPLGDLLPLLYRVGVKPYLPENDLDGETFDLVWTTGARNAENVRNARHADVHRIPPHHIQFMEYPIHMEKNPRRELELVFGKMPGENPHWRNQEQAREAAMLVRNRFGLENVIPRHMTKQATDQIYQEYSGLPEIRLLGTNVLKNKAQWESTSLGWKLKAGQRLTRQEEESARRLTQLLYSHTFTPEYINATSEDHAFPGTQGKAVLTPRTQEETGNKAVLLSKEQIIARDQEQVRKERGEKRKAEIKARIMAVESDGEVASILGGYIACPSLRNDADLVKRATHGSWIDGAILQQLKVKVRKTHEDLWVTDRFCRTLNRLYFENHASSEKEVKTEDLVNPEFDLGKWNLLMMSAIALYDGDDIWKQDRHHKNQNWEASNKGDWQKNDRDNKGGWKGGRSNNQWNQPKGSGDRSNHPWNQSKGSNEWKGEHSDNQWNQSKGSNANYVPLGSNSNYNTSGFKGKQTWEEKPRQRSRERGGQKGKKGDPRGKDARSGVKDSGKAGVNGFVRVGMRVSMDSAEAGYDVMGPRRKGKGQHVWVDKGKRAKSTSMKSMEELSESAASEKKPEEKKDTKELEIAHIAMAEDRLAYDAINHPSIVKLEEDQQQASQLEEGHLQAAQWLMENDIDGSPSRDGVVVPEEKGK